jgi:FkbM family methyltransferase
MPKLDSQNSALTESETANRVGKGGFGRRAAWQFWHSRFGKTVDLPFPDLPGTQVRCFPDCAATNALMRGGAFPDRHTATFLRRYLRPEDSVADVGANVGLVTLQLGALVGPNGRVDAFEPSSLMRRRLSENLSLNRMVQVAVHARMAGAETRQARFADGTTKSGRRRPPLPIELATGVIGVDCTRLDDALGERRYLVVRIDVAGQELAVLQGMTEMLREANPPALLIALDDALRDYALSPERVMEWLAEHGYEIALYDADRHQIGYGAEPWKRSRTVIAIARAARNLVSRRLAGLDDKLHDPIFRYAG